MAWVAGVTDDLPGFPQKVLKDVGGQGGQGGQESLISLLNMLSVIKAKSICIFLI